jgi:hypothetical protein
LWQRKGLAQNAFTYYYAHRRLSKAQMEKADADVMQNRCVIKKEPVRRQSLLARGQASRYKQYLGGRAITALKRQFWRKNDITVF